MRQQAALFLGEWHLAETPHKTWCDLKIPTPVDGIAKVVNVELCHQCRLYKSMANLG